MMSTNILELSESVAINTAVFHDYLVMQGIDLPSHDPAVPPVPLQLPKEISNARDKAIQASYDLYELLVGPYGLLLDGLFQVAHLDNLVSRSNGQIIN